MYNYLVEPFDYNDIVLDLHDISLLLTYERGITEPRFRHAKLREVATGLSDFQTIKLPDAPKPKWSEATIPRTGYVFVKPKQSLSKAESEELDLPSNMLLKPVSTSLQNLSSKQLETYYWQPRNHDGCYRTVRLFQHFMDLFPSEFTRIMVRAVANNKPRTYTTLASDRLIIEMKLRGPKSMNFTCALPEGRSYVTGSDEVSAHVVLAFPAPSDADDPQTILDLASLQFGDAGRGCKGRGLFVLEPVQQYKERLKNFADGNNFLEDKITQRITSTPDDDFLKNVANRAKERWEKRKTDFWCGHCGSPARNDPLLRCSKCQQAHYCNSEHQLAAWPFHKHFCVDPSAPKPQWV
ncbi:hypothetical protein CPB83DRAFT_884433 [Crepidotus variabilis]|uniref:MYND-type domain-containing protein n=1 Tax=Crepidotus variabilis TaxID=179855 RepID=A0A9P6JN68_9AGAR|nr:hypothetical protein CPB83DRAFT_884433 [Crepidotus variabilis]